MVLRFITLPPPPTPEISNDAYKINKLTKDNEFSKAFKIFRISVNRENRPDFNLSPSRKILLFLIIARSNDISKHVTQFSNEEETYEEMRRRRNMEICDRGKDRCNGANESEGIEGGLVENGKENGMKRKGCVGGAVVSVKWGKLQNNETAG